MTSTPVSGATVCTLCDNSTKNILGLTDLSAQKLVDDAYQKDPSEWIKRSIHTSAKVRENFLSLRLCLGFSPLQFVDGQVQLRPRNHELCRRILEHRALQSQIDEQLAKVMRGNHCPVSVAKVGLGSTGLVRSGLCCLTTEDIVLYRVYPLVTFARMDSHSL